MLSIFSCVCWPSVCLLWKKCLFRSSIHFLIGLFVFLILSCMGENIRKRSDQKKINLQNVQTAHEILFMVSFAVQKLFSFIRSHFFIFVFISITLGGGSKGSCCDLCQTVFCLYFPLRVLQCPALHLGL